LGVDGWQADQQVAGHVKFFTRVTALLLAQPVVSDAFK
jgi:hypothetical protein